MKVSYRWLSEYVDLTGISPEELADRLTSSGVAVDAVEYRNKGVKGVVVGYVTHKEKHPDADKLNLCKVDVGQGEELQIVCGAANVAQGQKVPVALIGAELPGGIKIKRAKLRGVESQGMICSAKELGLEDRLLPKEIQEGIYVLPEALEVGQDIEPLLGLDDAILELDLTPNRSDCLSMIGVAYEVAAILDREVRLPDLGGATQPGMDSPYTIQIDAQNACLDYAAQHIRGVRIGPSPLWLQHRLMAAGIRPINNIVDITNYVMLEYGQPLHAFDATKLVGQKIQVRLADAGERITTLDGVERTLDAQMLLICDSEKPIAIAGVMGGENSEVSQDTTEILLESAYFSGLSVRYTSKILGLRSEASLRFEKGVDPNRVIPALQRATSLITRLAGGEVSGGIARKTIETESKIKTIGITVERINQVLGTSFTESQVADIFRRLGFQYEVKDQTFTVTVPTRRPDLGIEADLIEEVARIAGYDQIPTTLPVGVDTPGGLTSSQSLRRKLKRILTSAGFYQAVSYSLTHSRHTDVFAPIGKAGKAIPVSMPMSEEREYLRNNLLPSLIEAAQYNLNRNQEDIALFELGKVYLTDTLPLSELPEERYWLAGYVTGSVQSKHWTGEGEKVDFYWLKGVLESLFELIGIQVQYVGDAIAGLHPGRGARIEWDGKMIGYIGQLHPELQKEYDLNESYVFQIDLESLLSVETEEIHYQALPKYPSIRRDLAIVIDEDVRASDLLAEIKESAGEWLEDVQIFDVYQGQHIAKGKKSIAFSLVYRHPERTLQDEEVQKAQDQILKNLGEKYQAEIRS